MFSIFKIVSVFLLVILIPTECFRGVGSRLLSSRKARCTNLMANAKPSHAENEFIPISCAATVKRNVRKLSYLSTLTLLIAKRANAGIFTSFEQDLVNEIASFQKPIAELLDQLNPTEMPNAIGVYTNVQLLKGGKEDSQVVLNYLETYIKPCQKKMEELAKISKLNTDSQEKLETLPLLMKGHIVELREAIKDMSADLQSREVKEIQETLSNYLGLLTTKYEVQFLKPYRPLSDAELFGPLGCEFWGKKRIEGSNQCAP